MIKLLKIFITSIIILIFILYAQSDAIDYLDECIIHDNLGKALIQLNNHTLKKYHLPNQYYGNIDFYSFLAYMSYKSITRKNSSSYKIVHSDLAYTDKLGYRRYKIQSSHLSVNNQDDYIVAVGNFYKEKGSSGDRFLVITDTGMYTIIIGDEKSNNHTDKLNMFTYHGKGKVNVLEFIVDTKKLESSVKRMGSVTASSVKEISGKLLFLYKIQ